MSLDDGNEFGVLVRHHHHVNPGVDRQAHGVRVVHVPGVGDAVDGLPVRDEDAPEPELPLEDVGEEELVGVELLVVPGGVGDHDGGHALLDGVGVRVHVGLDQGVVAELRVARVLAVGGAAIAHEVLRARQDLAPVQMKVNQFAQKLVIRV